MTIRILKPILFTLIQIVIILITALSCYGQTDTTVQDEEKYSIAHHFPFYDNCKNCGLEKTSIRMLCGHNYKTIFAGYHYDGNNWASLGYSRDITSCFPDIGGQYFATAYSIKIDPDFANSLNFTYLRNHLFGLQFYFIKYGLNLETITNFTNSNFILRPEIRLCDNMDYFGILSFINISYGYNIRLNNSPVDFKNLHQLSIFVKLRNKGPIS